MFLRSTNVYIIYLCICNTHIHTYMYFVHYYVLLCENICRQSVGSCCVFSISRRKLVEPWIQGCVLRGIELVSPEESLSRILLQLVTVKMLRSTGLFRPYYSTTRFTKRIEKSKSTVRRHEKKITHRIRLHARKN